MPKTAKKGFTYFRFETDHFYDPKVKRLKNKFGMEGWGVFHFIVNEIYRVEGCYMVMDADGLFDISDYSRMDEKKVSDIIDYCAELGLFNKELWQDKQILTSEEIQELYVGNLQGHPPQARHSGKHPSAGNGTVTGVRHHTACHL